MADLVELLQKEQGDESPEVFANRIGIRYSSLNGYYKGAKSLGVKNARRMAKYYAEQGDWNMVYNIASVVLDLDLAPPKEKAAQNN